MSGRQVGRGVGSGPAGEGVVWLEQTHNLSTASLREMQGQGQGSWDENAARILNDFAKSLQGDP